MHQFSSSQVSRCRTHCRGTGSLLAPVRGRSSPSISSLHNSFREAPTRKVIVLTLVMKGSKLVHLISTTNVIGHIIGGQMEQSNARDRQRLGHTVRAVFPDLAPDRAQAFIEQVSAEETSVSGWQILQGPFQSGTDAESQASSSKDQCISDPV